MRHQARVVFMGTPDFAVPSLQALVNHGYEVVSVITQPDKPVGRKQVLTPSPVKVAALELGLPVFQPERVRRESALEHIRSLEPDVCVTAAYGQILPQALLDIPRVGCLNVHASLLPRWRGAAPIHRAIIAGDVETGITIMEMVLELDAGPVVGMKRIPIEITDNVGTLHDKLARLGADLLLEVLPGYLDGTIVPQAQPQEGVTYAERIRREDEFIDWNTSVMAVYNQIRGLSPWPGATTFSGSAPIKIWDASLVSSPLPLSGSSPGDVEVHDGRVCARCQDGWIELLTVQPAGKRKMGAGDWMRGQPSRKARFGSEVEPQ
jgi:methionyl-tRNA formyltransferase